MKAMIIRKYGGPEVFELADVVNPELREGYVLIKVVASSVNPLESKIRSGLAANIGPVLPAILNADVSGEIVAVGAGTDPWKVGDQVFGCTGGVGQLQGALAEYMLADARLIAKKPENIDHFMAALFPLVTITAWEGIVEKSLAKPGEKLLIHGAAGGVGHIAVQLAKQQGAIVYGTVTNPEKVAITKEYGADYVIVANDESVESYVAKFTDGKGFDAVFDTVGGNNLIHSFDAVKLKGTVCTTNARATLNIGTMHSKAITLHALLMTAPMLFDIERERHGIILDQARKLIEQGSLRILQDPQKFAFTDISKAHEYLESGKATGKISLVNSFC
ncbi:Quinone oxidoreductase 1 [Sporomusa silvacetica DSM 10669]|uniref:Quinone oxidoreductase 1 n=1 Tax=Sporomusa silvacetica DSM 10669 TaxID=1123289 RepID=A0ABZ3INR9_9FIRM|nr:zinc-dependent alcohol dehydrogenase family protein [Sporomusa silvacetica]OZC19257.1 quinone oxidoreductase 1 [Sporomusa silvacetica DSM 10669]